MSTVSPRDSRRAWVESLENKLDRFADRITDEVGSIAKRVEEYFGSLLRRSRGVASPPDSGERRDPS